MSRNGHSPLRRPWARRLGLPEPKAQRLPVTGGDGLPLSVWHIPARGEPRGTPVMLLHGLAANRYTFHFPGRSVAEHLSSAGFNCYVPELRGHGRSARPAGPWALDDYLIHDLPRIIEAVLIHSGAEALHWVGHSMGGVLLFCYAARYPDAPIARGVTVGSALDYKVGRTGFSTLLKLRPLMRRVPMIPYGDFVHWLAPLMQRVPNPIESFNVVRSNIEHELMAQAHANCFHNIPTALLDSLATTFEPAGFRSGDGRIQYARRARDIRFPVLLLAGNRDEQVAAVAVRATAAALVAGEAIEFGRAHGHGDDYGHFDLLLGRRAATEVWPRITQFLQRE